jgi:hypothetical protein
MSIQDIFNHKSAELITVIKARFGDRKPRVSFDVVDLTLYINLDYDKVGRFTSSVLSEDAKNEIAGAIARPIIKAFRDKYLGSIEK